MYEPLEGLGKAIKQGYLYYKNEDGEIKKLEWIKSSFSYRGCGCRFTKEDGSSIWISLHSYRKKSEIRLFQEYIVWALNKEDFIE